MGFAYKRSSKKINRKDALYGNLLDKRVRNSMDGQTLGIPVGPDTSLIIAEIIATSMDVKLRSRLGDIKGFRYMDDYYLYFSTKPEAEFALSTLHSIMKDFELELNPNKNFYRRTSRIIGTEMGFGIKEL
ncbi:RNA-directed DNA polymerase [Paenibacillus rhizoplanae]